MGTPWRDWIEESESLLEYLLAYLVGEFRTRSFVLLIWLRLMFSTGFWLKEYILPCAGKLSSYRSGSSRLARRTERGVLFLVCDTWACRWRRALILNLPATVVSYATARKASWSAFFFSRNSGEEQPKQAAVCLGQLGVVTSKNPLGAWILNFIFCSVVLTWVIQ